MKILLGLCLFFGATLTGAVVWLSALLGGAPDPSAYITVSPEQGRAVEVVSATGFVQAREVLPVGSESAGKVVEVCADFNQVVHEGDVLARLDPSLAQQHVKQAELAIEQARVAVKQAEAARDTAAKAASRERQRSPEVRRQPDMDVVESQLRTCEVAVEAAEVRVREAIEAQEQAKRELRQTTLRVPTLATNPNPAGSPNGVGTLAPEAKPAGTGAVPGRSFIVLERKVSLNQQIAPPSAGSLFVLAGGLEQVRVHAQVAEGEVNKVVRGQRVEFTVAGSSERERTFTGTVAEVRLVPLTDHGAIYYKVVIDAPNQRNADGDWYLRPGQTAEVNILRAVHENVWKMPDAALGFHPEEQRTAAATSKWQRWEARADWNLWRPVWIIGADAKPWPIFIRVEPRPGEQPGVQDGLATEVLEWDPELRSGPNGDDPATWPRFITNAPPARSCSLFHTPKIKF